MFTAEIWQRILWDYFVRFFPYAAKRLKTNPSGQKNKQYKTANHQQNTRQ